MVTKIGLFSDLFGHTRREIFFFFTDKRESVAQGQDDGFYAFVVGHHVVESSYALRLCVTIVGRVNDVSVP